MDSCAGTSQQLVQRALQLAPSWNYFSSKLLLRLSNQQFGSSERLNKRGGCEPSGRQRVGWPSPVCLPCGRPLADPVRLPQPAVNRNGCQNWQAASRGGNGSSRGKAHEAALHQEAVGRTMWRIDSIQPASCSSTGLPSSGGGANACRASSISQTLGPTQALVDVVPASTPM